MQRIAMRLRLEPGASATMLAHCLFPNSKTGRHVMQADIELGAGAELRYVEGHYHGLAGGMNVRPRLAVCTSRSLSALDLAQSAHEKRRR